MKLIVGLGNPGEQYTKTRHNLGFIVLDSLLKKLESVDKTFWDTDKKNKSEIKRITTDGSPALFVKPMTFMNSSGYAVAGVANYYKIKPEDIFVVHDDLDLPFGKLKVRFGGGAGGHNGVASVIEQLGTDKFLRIRLGIGHPGKTEDGKPKKTHHSVEDYVLSQFASNEKGKVKTMTKEASKTITLLLKHGIDTYMSKFHSKE